ncbi:hypothetical protein EYC80_001538 [Monilinia laxa]|uniref:Ketoreductase (KR) domain-containing protein n=1 Tax=Monilinia laxa TaxID=61186 RepID=A0A5N6K5C6_MONLA|nr:hypothetical protein EYC80_001538 [Monilinia laxa]
MASENPSIYLITGANRGLGLGLVAKFLARNHTIVVAAVRDPAISAKAFATLPTGTDSKLVIVKIDSSISSDAADAVKELNDVYGITRLDVVVASAGIATHFGSVLDTKPSQIQDHVNTNVYGPLTLFQAVFPLLDVSPHPKFLLPGSVNGSIAGLEKYPYPDMLAYGSSKAMAHFLVRKIHIEHGGEKGKLIAWCAYPGFVKTDTGNAGARYFGMAEAIESVDNAVTFLAKTIDEATMENTGGRFPSIYGGEIEWLYLQFYSIQTTLLYQTVQTTSCRKYPSESNLSQPTLWQ